MRQICDLIYLQAVHRARRGRYDETQAGMGSLFNEVIMRADKLGKDLRQGILMDGQQGGGGCRGNAPSVLSLCGTGRGCRATSLPLGLRRRSCSRVTQALKRRLSKEDHNVSCGGDRMTCK